MTPTNSLHQGDRPASLANPTGTRRGDSVIMTLFHVVCPLGRNANPTTQLAQQPSTLMTNCRPNDGRTKKYRKKVDLHFMHDSRTWRQRTGVKTRSHPPTLLACFIIRASFETVKVLVTHGRTQKTHGENIIIETSFHKRFLTSLKLMILLLVSQIEKPL